MLVDDAQEVKAVQSVEEAELASLGGWQQQEVEILKQPGVNASQPLPLLDEEDTVTPEEIKQERPWWMRGTWRMVVACSATIGVLHVMFSLLGLWGSSKQTTPSIVATDAAAIDQEVTARMEQLEAENENLKKEQVMGEPLPQQSSQKQPPQAVKVPPQPKKVVYTSVTPRRLPPSAPVAPRRAIAYTPQPPRRIAYTPPQPRISPRPVISTPPRIVFPSKELLDPTAQWLAAANIGSYGSTSPANNSQKTSSQSDGDDNYQTASYQSNDDSGWEVSGGVGTPPQQASNATNTQVNNSVAQASGADNQSDTNYQNVDYSSPANNLIVGTKANGKLATAISWSGRLENPTQNFLIELNEPLKAADNTVAIPKGAYLVAKIIAATEAGLLQMSVSSMLVNSNGQTTERSVPEGAILILGKGGRPLKASAERPGSGSSNLGTVILSGISSATGLINQPSSQSIINSGGGYQSTITNGNPNYLAGFGQGAAQALLQQAQNRNQQAVRYRESEPTVFVLNQGASVQIFVNQSVSLGNP